LENCSHGDFPRWQAALEKLPESDGASDLDRPAPRFGAPTESPQLLTDLLMDLHPWRKGPLEIAGVAIDTEWRSDLKWNRIAPHVALDGHRVLDIGCGNGYYGWRMLSAGAELVIGVDPTWVYVMQWLACRHFSGDLPNYVLPLGIEQLPDEAVAFDTVFSMGVLYHRRHPLSHLDRIRRLLRPGGTLVLETLVLPEDQSMSVLEPPGRYARMRNVWAVPGGDRLLEWVCEAGFAGAEIVDVNQTSLEEQRATPWMRFESLEKAIDPGDRERTIEGHPRPLRALLIAQAGRS
jgi:tRNA (mo5U34)-methyltransferase